MLLLKEFRQIRDICLTEDYTGLASITASLLLISVVLHRIADQNDAKENKPATPDTLQWQTGVPVPGQILFRRKDSNFNYHYFIMVIDNPEISETWNKLEWIKLA